MSDIRYLNWDSNFFGFKIGSIRSNLSSESLTQQLKSAKEEKYDLIYIFDERELALNSDVVEQYNVSLVDTKIVFSKDLREEQMQFKVIDLHSINKNDLNSLYFLAMESGSHSRYKFDTNLNKKFEELYKTWIDNSINKIIADKIFVYKYSEEIAGFATLKHSGNQCSVGLIAVSPELRGQKIGAMLMKQCFYDGMKNGCGILNVTTQLKNANACRFYRNLGMEIKETTNVYHAWIKK